MGDDQGRGSTAPLSIGDRAVTSASDDSGWDDDQGREPGELRSFGRRRGRRLSATQQRLIDELLPRICVDPGNPLSALPAELRTHVWLEIGFGGGEHLVWQAQHNPTVGLIGCEPFEEGVVKVLTRIEALGLGNIRLHADDARPVLRGLPEASVERAFILFPDPWPKRKHQKRRLINPSLLAALARVLKPGAELRIGTDIADYARTILMAFQGTDAFRWMATSPGDWRQRPADWPETRYEQKAIREGRRSVYLSFGRV